MNKFLSLFAAVMILSSTVVSAGNFNGFGAGVSAGLTVNKIKSKESSTIGTRSFSETFSKSKTSFAGGIFVNYLYSQADSFLWGLEASFDYDFAAKVKISEDVANFSEGYTIKKTWSTFFTPKFGWNFQDCWTLYGLVGLGGSVFKIDNVFDKGASTNFHFAIAPGVGAEVAVTDNIKVGAEYKYIHYVSKTEKVTSGANSAEVKVTPSAHDFRLRATFTF